MADRTRIVVERDGRGSHSSPDWEVHTPTHTHSRRDRSWWFWSVLPFPQLAEEADVLGQSDKDQQVLRGQHLSKVCRSRCVCEMLKSAGGWGCCKQKNNKSTYFWVLKSDICGLSHQHHSEGAEGSASADQLQGPRLSHTQRQITGMGGRFASCRHGLCSRLHARKGALNSEALNLEALNSLFLVVTGFVLCFYRKWGPKVAWISSSFINCTITSCLSRMRWIWKQFVCFEKWTFGLWELVS